MSETKQTLRDTAREMVSASVVEAATKSHKRNYQKLHVLRDGTVSWFESFNESTDVIDRYAERFQAIPSVVTTGTGGYACNCDYCNDDSYKTHAAAIADAVACDFSDMEDSMLKSFDEIPAGYFDDEDKK